MTLSRYEVTRVSDPLAIRNLDRLAWMGREESEDCNDGDFMNVDWVTM